MKVAICFWGITRSLKYTITSINENIIDIFKKNNINYDIFMHTFKLNNYNNIRTLEVNNNVDNDEYKLLNPTFLKRDSQDEIKTQINITQYRTFPDPWKSNYNSVDNYILASYSKEQLVNMIEESTNKYDYIIKDVPSLKPSRFAVARGALR
jgi:hypothetical protein